MSMNPYLAAMYDTHGYGQAAQEEQTKIASLELFAKTAAAEGIDLSQLSPEQQNSLYSNFISKLAMEHEGESEDKEEESEDKEEEKEEEEEAKESAARREFAQKHEWQQKVAEADFLGRTMAHAFWNESGEIEKQAKLPPGSVKPIGQSLSELGSALKKAPGELMKKRKEVMQAGREAGVQRHNIRQINKPVSEGGLGAKAHQVGGSLGKVLKGRAAQAAPYAAGAAAAGGAAAGVHKATKKKDEGEDKEASAFDLVSAEQAVKIAEAAGWNTDEAIDRLNAVITLGGPSQEETKVAHVSGDYDAAVNVRGLEFLEAAGYPVDWEQVFGS